MPGRSGSKKAVYAALAGNVMVAASKFVAAILTGSAAMASEGVHSVVDTMNEILLLYGEHRSNLPADEAHPLGYGRELYFWSFMVALMVFALGAGISMYQGMTRVLHPRPLEDVTITYVVLGLSMLFEGVSLTIARREFNRRRGRLGYLEAIRQSKDPALFTVLLEDFAALIGLSLAAVGIFASVQFHMPALDGAASLCIGFMLALVAIFLARETKELLIGEQASEAVKQEIIRIAGADQTVHHANGVITVHMGPDEIVAALSAEFDDGATASEIEACVTRIERAIKAKYPNLTTLFVKPQTAERWRAVRTARRGSAA
jgi:cation diffusion facilitator family transporter